MIVTAGRARAAWLWVLLALLSPSACAQARYGFNLPAQPLADALRAVARRAHVTVAFDPDTVAGVQAPALSGSYSAREALERLLHGKRMRVRATSGGSFWVEAVPVHGPPAG